MKLADCICQGESNSKDYESSNDSIDQDIDYVFTKAFLFQIIPSCKDHWG